MKNITEKINLIKTIRKITIIIYGVAMLSFAAVGLIDRFSLLRDETDKVRNNYISTQKQLIETQVQSAVQFITLAGNSGISKENILKSLSQIKFGHDRDGYIFVNTYDGIPLLLDAEQVINGKSIWDLTDPNGVKVIQEERRASLNPNGDYIYYSWLKLSTNTVSPKVSFIKAYPEWHWMIGAGVYLDSIEIEIHKLQKTIIIDTVVKTILLILIMLFILIVIHYIFKRFITNVENELNIFSSYFDDAASENKKIDVSNIRYKEFYNIAEDINKMLSCKLEAELKNFSSEQRLRLQREQSPLGYIEYNHDLKIVDWNPSAERIFGYTRDEIVGSDMNMFLSSKNFNSINSLFEQLLEEGSSNKGLKQINENIRKNGEIIICEWYNKTIIDQEGEVLGIVAIVNDITERIKMEENLAKSLEEKQILLKEVHHRVKNNMAIISSFISLQSMNIKDEQVLSMLQSTENRVRSMALIHEYLYKSENLKDINVKRYVDELVSMLLGSYQFGADKLTTKIEIAQINLELDILIPLGMIINEIISNALKYAFKNIDSPELSVTLAEGKKTELILTIADNGIGLPESSKINESDSIGFVLINSLVDQIHGTLSINREFGTKYQISVLGVKAK